MTFLELANKQIEAMKTSRVEGLAAVGTLGVLLLDVMVHYPIAGLIDRLDVSDWTAGIILVASYLAIGEAGALAVNELIPARVTPTS